MPPKQQRKKTKKAPRPPPKPAHLKAKEITALGKLLRVGGRIGGGFVGNMAGLGAQGTSIGEGLGAQLSRWLGQGDYELSSNTIVKSLRAGGQIPSMHSSNQSTVIRHKEYIGDVVTSNTPGNLSSVYFAINPGLAASFPWLSSLAQNYQEYEAKGIVYEFKSTSADALNSTNTALGTVMMATQYRPSATAFTSKSQILQEYFSCDGKPSTDFCHPVECDPKENPFQVMYTRAGNVPAGEDLANYDLGKFSIHTTGFQGASVNIGELWVTYEFELKKPVFSSLRNPSSEYYHGWSATSNIDSTHPFGTNSFLPSALGSESGSFSPVLSGQTITFPTGTSGFFILFYTIRGTSGVIGVPTITCTTNCHNINGFLNSSNSQEDSLAVNPSSQIWVAKTFSIDDTNRSAVLTWGTFPVPTSITSMDIYICQINDYGQTSA